MQNFSSKEIAELSHHVLLLLQQKRLRHLKTSFEYDLLSSHAQALQILNKHKSLAVGELKTKLGLSFGSATKIIDVLERKKLVDRKKFVKSDLRSTEVLITKKGRQIAQEIEQAFVSQLDKSLSHFTSDNKKILLKGLRVIVKQFSEFQISTP